MSGSKGCITILLVTGFDPNSLFHDLAVFWRNGELSVQIRSFSILLFAVDRVAASVHHDDHLFQVSFTERQHARSLYPRSNPNSLIGFLSPTLSVHRLLVGKVFLYRNSHINNFVCVLGNLDVLGLLGDLLLIDGCRFSVRSS